jgi:hypothetical protein
MIMNNSIYYARTLLNLKIKNFSTFAGTAWFNHWELSLYML